MVNWKKHFPEVIKEESPVKKTAAELISTHHKMSTETLSPLIEIDPRIHLNLDIQLKYKVVLAMEK